MPLDHSDWANIYRAIEAAAPTSIVVQGQVIKADPKRNLIWLKEFGDRPVPLYSFEYDIEYYDTEPNGNVTSGQPVPTQLVKKTARRKIVCPKVGDIVLVLQQHGSRRLPKCVGVLRSTGFSARSD